LMAKPDLLILDEPCAGLDPVARERFLINLQKLARKKRRPNLILVTHHIEEIFPEITHVLLLKNGKVLDQGPKADVLSSANLSKAFGATVRVRKSPGQERWNLQLDAA
ncbi:MAG: ABC transporter ATP-binding protein, partial [Verrucomicrobiales bacterium]|nr:ABC transporter ATP-binding protein [Verrucomicrobiales bacterium]